MTKVNQHALDVLSFWHQTEFFDSIDLKDVGRSTPGVIYYQGDEIARNPSCLPWLDREKIRWADKGYSPQKHYSYTLYLGVFERSEFFDQATTLLGSADDGAWDERRNDTGLTCCATVNVNKDGILQLPSLSLSTAPWALGKVLKNSLGNVEFDDFERESSDFIHSWQAMEKLAANIKHEVGAPSVFTTFELIEILKQLSAWAGFEPQKATAALIVKLKPLDRVKGTPKAIYLPAPASQRLANISNELVEYRENEDACSLEEEERDDGDVVGEPLEDSAEPEVSILNSFFVRDIECARRLVKNNALPDNSPLMQYLSSSYQYQPDLLSEGGEALIRKQLSLEKTPLGRWPESSEHTMSMMQQFAINTAKERLDEGGLYSVNGPPGTGKTTMLRDFIADNMVKRGKILSELSLASDAFAKELTVKIGDEMVSGIKQLIPELSGFEMVVVSSNNTAVENISKELPQCKTLGSEFVHLEYLRPVAQKLAANHYEKGDTAFVDSLGKDDDCWGLIAAAMGNGTNRSLFGSRIQFKNMAGLTPVGEPAERYNTIAPTINGIIDALFKEGSNPKKSFSESQRKYKQAEADVERGLSDLARLEKIMLRKKALRQQEKDLLRVKNVLLRMKSYTATWIEKKIPLRQWRPWICRYFLVRACHRRIALREIQLEYKKNKYENEKKTLDAEIKACEPLAILHKGVTFGGHGEDHNSAEIQRTAFGHSKELNRLRAELTVAAFELHQAWLVACYRGCFSKNVNKFVALINGEVKDAEHAKAMWQCFFMVVPLVSSAFASVANQFSALRAGDIGWLFIDEAGQATPQQAVGALMRAKRAVVVGDPLQVEPVFTTPPEFVEFFGKAMLGEGWSRWSPTVTSVQVLADRVNPYGTYRINEHQWLGSPLRVHRRCQDPMFSIANKIAYNDTMIHGSDNIVENDDFVWGLSCWYDWPGEVEGKHFVPAQAVFVLRMIKAYINKNGVLPNCYIITPFRDVKRGLLHFLRREFSHTDVKKNDFDKWLSGRVGTVHTFQGKEEDFVIFVLGVSSQNAGAEKWAASKPNLLNVAVTRAKKRVYIVGCKTLWAGLDNFSCANTELAPDPFPNRVVV
ncbi:hypothetical protein A9Q99_17405 [Gammaproteobacteria bacterium 45_16_T64]|nr:hypothetical protein A9Q99_17405 [Gammaproteobacteria bacterium 45_16_T64]